MYCVYLTTYTGLKMPGKYVGSSSTKRISLGYKGSVRSKKWSRIWKEELTDNPHLFSVQILSEHFTRELALQAELEYQIEHDVVKSNEWVNESYACVKGYFGRDVSGSNNPMYNKGYLLSEWSKNNVEKCRERNKKAALKQWSDSKIRDDRISAMKGIPKTRKTQTQEEFCELQRKKALIAREKLVVTIIYNDIVYYGWKIFVESTGISKYRFLKHKLGVVIQNENRNIR